MMAAAMSAEPMQIEIELVPNGQRVLSYIDEYQRKRQMEYENKKPHQEMPKRKAKHKNRTKA